jgi:hypothetical protein
MSANSGEAWESESLKGDQKAHSAAGLFARDAKRARVWHVPRSRTPAVACDGVLAGSIVPLLEWKDPNMNLNRQWVGAMAGLALCASLWAPVARAQSNPYAIFDSAVSKRAKSVSVLVATGYQAQVVTLGKLLNASAIDKTVARNDDLLADRVYTQIKAELEQEQRYQVKRLAIQPERARQLVDGLWDRRQDRFGMWPKDMKDLVARCECDAVLLVADGPNHNTMVEAGLTFGPSFVGKTGLFGGKDVARAHVRAGFLSVLVDPATGERVRSAVAEDRPDYRDDAATWWPGADGTVSEAHWSRLADYLVGLRPAYRKSLAMVGLRPSCAHLYAPNTAYSGRTGEMPPPLPEDAAAKCPDLPTVNG